MYCKIFVNDQGDKPTLLNVLAKGFQAEKYSYKHTTFPSWRELVARAYPQLSCPYGSYLCEW